MEHNKSFSLRVDGLFYFMVGLIALHQGLSDSSFFNEMYAFLKNIVLFIIIVMAFIQGYALKKTLLIKRFILLLFIFLSIYSSFMIGNTWLLYLFIIIFFIPGKNINSIVKIITVIMTVIFFANCSIFLFNLLTGNIHGLEFIIRHGESIPRWFMYYNSPNGASRNLIFICLGWLYVNGRQIKEKYVFLMIITSVLIYILTLSDAVWIVPLICLFYRVLPKLTIGLYFLNKIRVAIFVFGFVMTGIYFMFSILGYADSMNFFDELLTGRLHLAYLAFMLNGFTLLGQEVKLGLQHVAGQNVLLTCDNGYIFCLIGYGAVYLLYFLYVIFKITKRRMSVRDNIVLIVFGIYFLIENRFVDLPSAIPIIIIFNEYLNYKEKVL